jgi:acyl carrier protein phosphodiesterase
MKLVALTSEQNNGQIIIKSAHSDSVSKTVIETEYTVDIDGAIKIKRQIDISDNNLPEIPRIGIKFTLSWRF